MTKHVEIFSKDTMAGLHGYPDGDDQMFSSRTVPELLRAIQGMMTEARDLDVPRLSTRINTSAPPPGQRPGHRFGEETGGIYGNKDHGMLAREAERIYARIQQFRAGIDASDERSGSPGLRRLRSDPRAETIRQQTLTDQRQSRRDAEARIMKEKQTMLNLEDAATSATATEGTSAPARKASKKVAKKAKKTKKTKAAKPAKKVKAAKAAKKGGGAGRASYDENHKITWTGKENPRREGSAAYDRLEKVRKHGGKTVKTHRANGGRDATLTFAVKNGLAKVA